MVDIGPGAGVHGGHIVAEGTPQDILDNKKSITGQYLSGKLVIPTPPERRKAQKGKKIHLDGATGNNLKNVSVDVPLGLFVAVTGVSRSAASRL